MKYTFYYTDNNNARTRGYEQDKFFRKTFNLENDREAIRKVLEIQDQAKYDEFDEKFDKASSKELKDWVNDYDISGDPVVFYVENAQGKIIYDSGLDMEDWMTDEDKIEDLDESRKKMKYRFYWTNNEHAYSRTEGDDEFNDDTLDLENDREALKEVLYTQGQFNEDDEDDVERFENSSLAELEEWANEIDVGFGSPVVFWVKNRNSKLIYDSGIDIDEWKSEDIDESRSRRLRRLHESEYTVQPKTKDELKDIIDKTIREDGYDCDLNFIDTSKITDMSYLFFNSKFDGDISKWNVSNVKDMHLMFYGSEFNGDISKWDVSNVRNMDGMFTWAEFIGDISKWDVSNVVDMTGMFEFSRFKGDISKWDVSNVRNMDGMFYGSEFNGDISKWDVSNVRNMYSMFEKSPLEGNEPVWYKD